MTRALDRNAILRRATWRNDIDVQVINADIDGLLTGALLYHARGWPLVGVYDTEHLWLEESWMTRLRADFSRVLWVDVDMCWPGARSLSQHVITIDHEDASLVEAYKTTLNPSLAAGHAARANYRTKYPFGTFQWAWWLLGRAPPRVDDVVQTGLVWMPDGGFRSVVSEHRRNCIDWAVRRLPDSPLAPLIESRREREAEIFVSAAEEYLKRESGVRDHWRNRQYAPTRTGTAGVTVLDDPGTESGRTKFNAVLRAVASAFDWEVAALPKEMRMREGTWATSSYPPRGWPESTRRRELVSIAMTGFSKVCYTLPDARPGRHSIREALP